MKNKPVQGRKAALHMFWLLVLLAGCAGEPAGPVVPADNESVVALTAHPTEQVHTFSREESSILVEALREAVLFEGAVTAIGETMTIRLEAEDGERQDYPVWINEKNVMIEQDRKRYVIESAGVKRLLEAVQKEVWQEEVKQ